MHVSVENSDQQPQPFATAAYETLPTIHFEFLGHKRTNNPRILERVIRVQSLILLLVMLIYMKYV